MNMNILVHSMLLLILLIINSTNITCKKKKHTLKAIELSELRDTLKLIYQKNSNYNKRRSNKIDSLRMKHLREALSNIKSSKFKTWLRHEAIENIEEVTEPQGENELENLVENELLNALSKKSSALLDRPYVQKKGRNDFLVIREELKDPFVTIVPNDIYYNSEKKCVNWLDDCNQKGLRERLLQKVNSPYKK